VTTDAPQPTDQQEVEWQFDAHDLDAVEAWLRALPSETGWRVEPLKTRSLTDAYLDTADWRMHGARYTLRVRQSDSRAEATMKAYDGGADAGGKRSRREITQPLPANPADRSYSMWLRAEPGPIADRLAALLGAQPLHALFTIYTDRRVFSLRLGDREMGEIALDRTTVTSGNSEDPARLLRVEVETPADLAPEAEPFIDVLREACTLQPGGTPKFQWAFGMAGLERPGELPVDPLRLRRKTPIGEVAVAWIATQASLLAAHEAGARLGDDPEALHQMRVATRRLRAALRLFAEVLPPEAATLNTELRWLAGVLGQVRDLDVQIDRLHAQEREPGTLQPLIAHLEQRRFVLRGRLLAALEAERYTALRAGLDALAAVDHAQLPPAAFTPVRKAAPALLGRQYRRLRRAARGLAATSPPEAYHATRIRAKRLRYALDPLASLYGAPAAEALSSLRRAQDILGEYQDAIVADQWLRDLSVTLRSELPAPTLFAMGRLAEQHHAEQRALREAAPGALRELARRWRRLRLAVRR